MTAAVPAGSSVPVPFHPASYTNSLVGTAMVLVTADGELDAHNARGLAEYVDSVIDAKRRLILDLRGLSFFGTQGFSALRHVDVTCSRRDVNWVLLPGLTVSRLLTICDPGAGLPVADTLTTAITTVSRPLRPRLKSLPR